MLISALCDYYQILQKQGKVLAEGFSHVNIHYLVGLTPEGKIAEIIDCQQKIEEADSKGKLKTKTIPRIYSLPARTEKTAIDANLAEHRPAYLFGLNYADGALTEADSKDKAKKSHLAFREKQLPFLEGLDSPLVNAYRNFIEGWNPQEEVTNPHLLHLGKAFSNSGLAFCMAGNPTTLLHEDPVFHEAYLETLQNTADSDQRVAICSILDRSLPIARIHKKIKGIIGGSGIGTSLVTFDNEAEESYGKKQAYNSNISQLAMEQYTEALNYLLKEKDHKTLLDDMTIVHWAISENDLYDNLVQQMLFSGEDVGFDEESVAFDEDNTQQTLYASDTDKSLKNLSTQATQGVVYENQISSLENLSPDVVFYMVGFKPNVSRLAVKFMYRKRYGELFQNLLQHQRDMQVGEKPRTIPLWRMKKELISPKSSKETIDPALASKILDAIVNGYNYPSFLLETVVRRVKCDSDDEKNKFIKLNPIRIGIIKACINRRTRLMGQKEEFTVSLDRNNENPAYLCGRLFAVLERLQLDVSGNLNRTIKDAYFASACSQPGIVFPKLIRLAQYHLGKSDYAGYYNSLIGEITGKLGGEFPAVLPLVEQGKFILGYYHQFFAKSTKVNGGTENE